MREEKKDELAKSVVGFLDKYGEKLWSGVKSTYGKAKEQAKLEWRYGYEAYLDKVFKDFSFAKPFLSGNYPRRLADFYIPLAVSCGKDIIEETSIEDLTATNTFAIVVANAGSGKTMLMRHLFVSTIDNRKLTRPYLPVFVELRELNNTDLSLFDLIKKKLRDNGFNFDDAFIEKAFEAGHFALFFDGFDEVAYDKREKTNLQIQELADKYSQNFFVLSSRPDDSLNRWTLFDVWKVQPLNLDKACKLVVKTTEDEELKEKFSIALQEKLFVSHKSFLSNPLLLSIMLITYKDNADIPLKLSTFYEQAYISLFSRHDATKNLSREKLSKLDIQDFKKVFSAFCFLSYQKQKYGDFAETELYEILDKSIKLSGIEVNKQRYIDDAIQAVCLLVRDGLNITFSHRSFQEYFASVFIPQISDNAKRTTFLKNILFRQDISSFRDSPFWLSLYDNSLLIFDEFVLVILDELAKSISFNGKFTKTHHFKIMNDSFTSLSLDFFGEDESEYGIGFYVNGNSKTYSILQFVRNFYLPKVPDFKIDEIEEAKFNNLFGKYVEFNSELPIKEFFETDILYDLFDKTYNFNTRQDYFNILSIRDELVEKLVQRELLFDADLLIENLT